MECPAIESNIETARDKFGNFTWYILGVLEVDDLDAQLLLRIGKAIFDAINAYDAFRTLELRPFNSTKADWS
jgi:hypothetical protein